MNDRYNLQRFVDAQAPVYQRVTDELRAGAKRSHWMWFIFPQIAGLGSSPMAQKYAIASADEAKAYLAHELLGMRLRACTELVIGCGKSSLTQILGTPDDIKFRSSMTLFSAVEPGTVFAAALQKFCPDGPDPMTLRLLGGR